MADTKKALDKAYAAGKASVNIQWDDETHSDVPLEKRVPGVHHCPFAIGDPQRASWLQGLKDGLERPEVDVKSIVADIDKELEA